MILKMTDYDAEVLEGTIANLSAQIRDEDCYPAFYHPNKKNLWYMKVNWGFLYWIVIITGISLALLYDFWPINVPRTSVYYKVLRHIAPFWSYIELNKFSHTFTDLQVDLLDILLTVHVGAMLMAIFIYYFGHHFKMYAEANSVISFFSYVMILSSSVSCIIVCILFLLMMIRGGNRRD